MSHRATIAGRLYVVVGVQQHGRRTRRPRPVTEHGRLAALDLQHLDIGQARATEQRGNLVRARTQLGCGGRIGRDRGDAHQPLEIRSHRGKNSREGATELVDLRHQFAYICTSAAKRSVISTTR